jgi:transposase
VPVRQAAGAGRFVWPPIVAGALLLTPAQLALLIEAIDWRRTVAPALPPRPVADKSLIFGDL